MSRKVVLAGGCRTAIGVMGGALSTVPAADLGTIVIKEAMNRAGITPDMVDEVYMGCVIQAGQGQNVARQAAVNAGIPVEAVSYTHLDVYKRQLLHPALQTGFPVYRSPYFCRDNVRIPHILRKKAGLYSAGPQF